MGPASHEDVNKSDLHAMKNGNRPSTSTWLETVAGIYVGPRKRCGDNFEDYGENGSIDAYCGALTSKMEKIASALSEVLNNHALLRVCVVVLRFDSDGARTARAISRLASSKLKTRTAPGHRGFDARLVFAWEKEPFRYSYAHSMQESKIWKSAEAVTKAQRHLSGECTNFLSITISYSPGISLDRLHVVGLQSFDLKKVGVSFSKISSSYTM